jgi:alkylation response protein AidB-like acyl-CoA dehydrogenase
MSRLRKFLQQRTEPSADTAFDAELLQDLQMQKFLDVADHGKHGALEAVLVAEEVSRVNGMVPVGLQALLAPALFQQTPRDVISICEVGRKVPIRFAEHATLLIEVDTDLAHIYRVDPLTAQAVKSNYVYPLAYPAKHGGEPIATLPARMVRRKWQLALSAEIVGAMDGALAYLVDYLTEREQFKKKIASFQAIQHRLAELSVTLECARHLVREAAWQDDDEAAATAACYAASAAHTLCLEAHQLSGARGFTLEFGLYKWTLRLQMLSLEANGSSRHAALAASYRWNASKLIMSPKIDGSGAQQLL